MTTECARLNAALEEKRFFLANPAMISSVYNVRPQVANEMQQATKKPFRVWLPLHTCHACIICLTLYNNPRIIFEYLILNLESFLMESAIYQKGVVKCKSGKI